MKLLDRFAVNILKRSGTLSNLSNPEPWLVEMLGGRTSKSGVAVNEITALYSTTVFACIRILAETLSSLPLGAYKSVDGGGSERDINHPLDYLLHSSPNPEMTSVEWMEAMMGHAALRGNCYSEIQFSNSGYPLALWPLRPDRVVPRRDLQTWDIVYDIYLPRSGRVTLPAANVLHIRTLSMDGIIGYSPICMAGKEAIGLSLAAEEYGARFFSNDATPGGILEHPKQLSQPAQDRLKLNWENRHEGLSNSHRMQILEEGMQWKQVGIAPQDAQMLESRKFQVSEICRIWRIPPHKVQDLDKATFSNIEHQAIEFVVDCIVPWVVRWEKAMNIKLFTPTEQKKYYTKFSVNGLLRGDIASRYAAYAIGRQWGWLCPDDIRALEDMNPLPKGQGKVYLQPMNMISAPEKRSKDPETDFLIVQRSAAGWEKVFEEAAARIIRREAADILQASKTVRGQDLQPWIEKFYAKHPDYVRKQLMPAVSGLTEAITRQAAGCFDVSPNRDLTAFCQEYTEKLSERFVTISREKLKGADNSGVSVIFESWKAERAQKFGHEEPIVLGMELIATIKKSAGLE